MSQNKEFKWSTFLLGSPVMGALITSMVALAIAFGPRLIDNSATPQPTAEALVAAEQPTEQPTEAATLQPSPTSLPTEQPTDTPPSPTALDIVPPTVAIRSNDEPPPPNTVQLLYDDITFTMLNDTDSALYVSNVSFVSASARWDATQWGTGLSDNFPAGNCLRMRDATTGNRQPPAVCRAVYGLQLVGGGAMFWRGVDTFDVIQDGQTIAKCDVSAGRCDVPIR